MGGSLVHEVSTAFLKFLINIFNYYYYYFFNLLLLLFLVIVIIVAGFCVKILLCVMGSRLY